MQQNVLQTLLDQCKRLLDDDSDVERIAQNLNFTHQEVKRAKDYLFVNPDLLDAVNVEMWQLAQANSDHPSVRNFIEHEILESGLMASMQISFTDTAARDAAWASAHSETLSRQHLPPFALFHPQVIAQHRDEFSTGFLTYWQQTNSTP
jgi:hypothetical protein